MQILFNSSEIIEAIDPTIIDEPDQAIWRNIFPIKYAPDVNSEAKTYITLSMYSPRVEDNVYKEVRIGFHIFTHIDLQKMVTGDSRTDYIQSEVDKLFNRNENFGIGLLELKANNELYVNEKYMGSTLWYEVTNFNSLSLKS